MDRNELEPEEVVVEGEGEECCLHWYKAFRIISPSIILCVELFFLDYIWRKGEIDTSIAVPEMVDINHERILAISSISG